ncbi:MAG: carboxylating nicotinate-nucleotide diphosphorylase [Planctomycetales bacterium]|nr:carboxylating nicotinate-nucleotide diphosphorylase [Planctomycetales bacterium]
MHREFAQVEWDADLEDDCRQLIRLAVREDLGRTFDWTTVSLVLEEATGKANIVNREAGVIAGQGIIPLIIDEMQCDIEFEQRIDDGTFVEQRTTLGTISGSARDLLVTERPILNFLGHLCGVATLANRFVNAVAGTKVRLYDTRKTIPGYRRLEKYAARCGGAHNHRLGLNSAILIKDNHLALGAGSSEQKFSPYDAVVKAHEFIIETFANNDRASQEEREMIVEIEVDTLEQLAEVIPTCPDIVLLDNMSPEQLAKAVAMRDEAQAAIELEASGGVSLETVRAIAESGVDRISVGAITHSARQLDIGLDWTK